MPRRKRSEDEAGSASSGLGADIAKMVESSIRDKVRQRTERSQLPDGVITIVFTDVEGSTELVRDLGDAGAHETLRRHDETVRRTVADHVGIEVERSGDAFMLAFRLPSNAIAFALALHNRLADEGDLRVRVGMDTGEVIREEKGYFGRTVFRAARIAEMGDGGQILASEATRVMIETTPKIRFVDLGEKTLDGLGDNHRVVRGGPRQRRRLMIRRDGASRTRR
jgi:class 3 adenylate cyclase